MLKILILILTINLQINNCKGLNISEKEIRKNPNIWLLALIGQNQNTSNSVNGETSVTATYPTNEAISVQVGQQIILVPSQHENGATYSINPSLPTGLNFDSSTGILSGTPSNLNPNTAYTITQTRPNGTVQSWVISLSITGNVSTSPTNSNNPPTNTTPQIPTISLASGHYNTAQTINFTSSNGGEIRCTTDGNEPTINSTIYSSVHIYQLAGLNLKCKNFKDGIGSETVTRTYSYSTIATGQTVVYITGDNGTNQSGVAKSYSDQGDGTVTDIYSGLIWQKCSRGQNNDTNCTGTALTSNWTDANSYCSSLSLGGKTWRLPSINELAYIIDFTKSSSPLINSSYFPNAVQDSYWSKNEYRIVVNRVWTASFNTGQIIHSLNSSSYYTRCVSGQSKENLSFQDNNDGTITDKSAGLTWQKCNAGRSGNNCETGAFSLLNLYDAINYCSNLNLAGRSWRIPTIYELRTLLDFTKTSTPSFNTLFPAIIGNQWSSTTDRLSTVNPINPYILYLQMQGNQDRIGNSQTFYVRCVSGP